MHAIQYRSCPILVMWTTLHNPLLQGYKAAIFLIHSPLLMWELKHQIPSWYMNTILNVIKIPVHISSNILHTINCHRLFKKKVTLCPRGVVIKYICTDSEQKTLGTFEEQTTADTLLPQQNQTNVFAWPIQSLQQKKYWWLQTKLNLAQNIASSNDCKLCIASEACQSVEMMVAWQLICSRWPVIQKSSWILVFHS